MKNNPNELEKEVDALKKINRVLMERVENSVNSSGNDYAIFEQNILLQKHIEERTLELELANIRLSELLDEQKLFTSKLVESEERYRLIFEQSKDAMMTLSPPLWKFTSGNPPICDMFGVQKVSDFTALEPWQVSPECQPDGSSSMEKSMEMIEAAMSEGSNFFEWVHMRSNGEMFPATVLLTRIEISGEIFLHATVRDISKHKKAEESLMIFKESLENSTDAIGIANPDGSHYYQNDVFSELFGIIGEDPAKVYVDKNDMDIVFKKIMPGGRWTGELKMFNKEGEVRDILLKAYANIDIEGNITALVGIHTDITERKQFEEEKEKLQCQLVQSQKMESVGRLAGGVAHDFNNMLEVILGYSDISLMKMNPDDKIYSNIIEIKKAAKRSAELTRQLLAFARKQTVAPVIMNLNETISGMLNMLIRLIGEDIDLKWLPGSDLKQVMIDPSQVDQIMANLCVNARDSISNVGKITIETRNADFDDKYCVEHADYIPGLYVMLAVSDNGCGMDKDTISKLFEPFFTTKKQGEGTGLGLAMIYGIVRQNGGFISVYSEPGEGTTIRVYIPAQTEKTGQHKDDEVSGNSNRGNETILLVEDEIMILKLAKTMLEEFGYKVLAASTPVEAIEIARDHSGEIKLLITDVIMPEMNGLDLAKRILEIYPEMKRLFMSGYTANIIAHHGVLDKGVNFLQKPFSMNDFNEKVREAIDN